MFWYLFLPVVLEFTSGRVARWARAQVRDNDSERNEKSEIPSSMEKHTSGLSKSCALSRGERETGEEVEEGGEGGACEIGLEFVGKIDSFAVDDRGIIGSRLASIAAWEEDCSVVVNTNCMGAIVVGSFCMGSSMASSVGRSVRSRVSGSEGRSTIGYSGIWDGSIHVVGVSDCKGKGKGFCSVGEGTILLVEDICTVINSS